MVKATRSMFNMAPEKDMVRAFQIVMTLDDRPKIGDSRQYSRFWRIFSIFSKILNPLEGAPFEVPGPSQMYFGLCLIVLERFL